ncbi:serine/threonine protein kinase [Streptomyces profundus]|uniref:serine/threonine protein kinase n=1 Tax=Streptomyces profundus TaxID=2867410 RepID=UPI002ADD5673|nr:serine/threonine-protein kinase [Streptomyces sp. MA3_2.13]UED84993.1 serine/threonine protein kinase [Streptomyces sp. MA3_2.13]
MDRLRPQDPHRIGEYRLLGRLGEGGMGQVYLARSERGRTVAVKTIKSELAQEPDFRRRFADEIAAARRVGDRWTAPVLDADTDAATPWVATGYIAGPSLHEVVGRDHGPLPDRSVLLLANGLGHALRAIHGAGLVHRDLKPSNVLMTIDGPRVIDFGIARALEPGPGPGVTRTGATVGSPGFMSPEQVRGQRVTPASDIFCLGSLLAYAATGRTPFGALDSGVHILMFRIAEEGPDLTGVPESLHPLISGCLTKEPERRIGVDQLLAATQPDTSSREPWLPGALVAQLGRHAVRLLDSENPLSRVDNPVLPGQPRTGPTTPLPESAPAADPTPHPSPQSSPGSPGAPRPAGSVPPPPGPPGAPSQAAQAAQASSGSWPGSRPQPIPSPYSQPGLGYPSTGAGRPHPSMPGSGSYGPGTPYPGANRGAGGSGWRSRRGPIAALIATGLVLVVLVVVLVTRLGGGGGGATIDEAYLGVWQGEYSSASGDARELRFEIDQGKEGELVGSALTLTPDTLCAYDVRLDSFDDQLNFTEESNWSVPEDQTTEACRDNSTVQSLRLVEGSEGEPGEMVWTYGEQETTLHSGPASSGEDVPEALVDDWANEFTESDSGDSWSDVITVQQGAVGDRLLRFERREQDNDSLHCVWENRLVRVEEDQLTFGPDELVESGTDVDCGIYAAIRVNLKEDEDDTIQIIWLNSLDKTPVEHERDD